ncbi:MULTISPECIES: hypothetical protein [Treponema]|uniref:Uncharacterized protein n=1 Tax=Treponema denticola (strain ATCC 35405 / DSM 14222 / CIP 103919 / JCM 8153 / KCTC 15104) TaxID=243275 RepID=Q73R65_TREDE|nr:MULTISPECIES: hypothetical protein [Treponema]AAS10723.1 hypothetical protein TDE_0226 [Treponema denticola ATCC 35405]EMB36418.1 hypothetical protein HMPREF9721_01644 [Treponema denticola ATCC 35404]EMB40632.1 hypothetical protein HMPREF9735_00190 [Treponema denticola ATCC 33521]HCY95705.1 hypothetical protein [Treponema sp.]
MDYVFVKDTEGFVVKKLKSQVECDEIIISEAEYKKLSGDNYYEFHFGHGGKRPGAGRKQKLGSPLKFQIRVTEEEKEFISYAREHNFDYKKVMEQKNIQ